MNRRLSGILLSRAVTGFLQFKAAEAVSASTLTSYGQHLRDLLNHCGDVDLGLLTSAEMCAYMAYLRTEYKPHRIAGDSDRPLAPKTLRNIWISFSSFFTWASRELKIENPMRGVPVPRFKKAPVEAWTVPRLRL